MAHPTEHPLAGRIVVPNSGLACGERVTVIGWFDRMASFAPLSARTAEAAGRMVLVIDRRGPSPDAGARPTGLRPRAQWGTCREEALSPTCLHSGPSVDPKDLVAVRWQAAWQNGRKSNERCDRDPPRHFKVPTPV